MNAPMSKSVAVMHNTRSTGTNTLTRAARERRPTEQVAYGRRRQPW
jgi:hypothetical protein